MKTNRNTVLLISYIFPKGKNILGAFVKDQAIALSLKYNVIVFALNNTKNEETKEFLINENCLVRYCEKDYFKNFLNHISFVFFLYKHKIKIIHAHTVELPYYFFFMIKFLFRKKLFITEHSPDIGSEIKSPYNHRKRRKIYQLANSIFCTSHIQINYIQENYNVKAVFLFNTVNDIFFNSQMKNNAIFKLGFIGLLNDERKGLDRLLLAVSRIHQKNFTLYIAGSGKLEDYYIQKSKSLKIFDNCKFLGAIDYDNRIDFFDKINCLVLPSRNEGLAHVILEALSVGLPVITTDCGGHKEVINSTNGYIFDNDENINNLIFAINKMNENIYNFDRNLIRETSIKKFSNCVFVEKISNYYKL